jgi:hypothetical protein
MEVKEGRCRGGAIHELEEPNLNRFAIRSLKIQVFPCIQAKLFGFQIMVTEILNIWNIKNLVLQKVHNKKESSAKGTHCENQLRKHLHCGCCETLHAPNKERSGRKTRQPFSVFE